MQAQPSKHSQKQPHCCRYVISSLSRQPLPNPLPLPAVGKQRAVAVGCTAWPHTQLPPGVAGTQRQPNAGCTYRTPADEMVGFRIFHQRPELGQEGWHIAGVPIHHQRAGGILHSFVRAPATLPPWLSVPARPCLACPAESQPPNFIPGPAESCSQGVTSAAPLARFKTQHNGRASPAPENNAENESALQPIRPSRE